jgi:curved DNA-binding protein CbpA
MGGPMHGNDASEDHEIDNSRFYELLKVPKTATTEEIKKSFRDIARKEHPDKGGDPEKVSLLDC